MRAIFALPALLLLGADGLPQHGPIYSGMPPERFWGEGVSVVAYVNDVNAICGDDDPDTVAMGCVRHTADGMPVTILPNPCFLGDVELFARLACHEKAHTLGWGRNHEL